MFMSRSTATTCSRARSWPSDSRSRRSTSLENADVILSLDADFLYAGFPGFTRYARDFAKRRNPDSGSMNRLYVVESTPSSTGAKADHRLPVRAGDIESFREDVGFRRSAAAAKALLAGNRKSLPRRSSKSCRAIVDRAW